MCHGLVVLGTKHQSDGRIFLHERQVFGGIIDVKIHLARVGVRKPAHLQIK